MRMYNPPHPGEILQGLWLTPLELSVTEAARRLGISRPTLSRILNGKGSITPELALRLELVFEVSALSWLGHQSAYNLWQMEDKRQELSKQVQPILRVQPAWGHGL